MSSITPPHPPPFHLLSNAAGPHLSESRMGGFFQGVWEESVMMRTTYSLFPLLSTLDTGRNPGFFIEGGEEARRSFWLGFGESPFFYFSSIERDSLRVTLGKGSRLPFPLLFVRGSAFEKRECTRKIL